jgi:CheY-like chemotaxis protein
VPVRVLIVDDNSAFRAAARQLLERAGFVVVAEAGDGVDGLRAAREHTPDLAIVDVQLPDLDGFELAERLRALELRPEVILTSSLDWTDFGALVASSSVLGFIPKAELSAAAVDALLARTP